MKRTDILALAERVEAGEGEDRELDRDIALSIYLTEIPATGFDDPGRIYSEYRLQRPDGSTSIGSFDAMIDRPTDSIDAVERLRERLLPGSVISIAKYDDRVEAAVWLSPDRSGYSPGARAPTEPRARLAAILRAYAGRGE